MEWIDFSSICKFELTVYLEPVVSFVGRILVTYNTHEAVPTYIVVDYRIKIVIATSTCFKHFHSLVRSVYERNRKKRHYLSVLRFARSFKIGWSLTSRSWYNKLRKHGLCCHLLER